MNCPSRSSDSPSGVERPDYPLFKEYQTINLSCRLPPEESTGDAISEKYKNRFFGLFTPMKNSLMTVKMEIRDHEIR